MPLDESIFFLGIDLMSLQLQLQFVEIFLRNFVFQFFPHHVLNIFQVFELVLGEKL